MVCRRCRDVQRALNATVPVYKPRGSSGYTCRLDADNGLLVAISWDGAATELDAKPAELPTRALVGAVQQFAENEFGRRRARTPEQRRRYEKQAKGWREEAERTRSEHTNGPPAGSPPAETEILIPRTLTSG